LVAERIKGKKSWKNTGTTAALDVVCSSQLIVLINAVLGLFFPRFEFPV
jgi:hypothetical protein